MGFSPMGREFDAAVCPDASLADLDTEAMVRFIRRARLFRGFPLQEDASAFELLTHLNLLNKGRPSHAAVLLFGFYPQRFLISSEIKCAHFHGTRVAKPIPSYQVYKGRAFELVDQAVDFVLSKIDLAVGTRAKSAEVPVTYEIPPEVVREAIVNAVAHRDYTSTGSVQVMLFADRLEVWNPGTLSPSLTLEKLRKPHGSFPANPLMAESLYLAKYIERMGTGTGDMITFCSNAGLREPEFSLTDGFVVTIWRKKSALAGAVAENILLPTGEVAGVYVSSKYVIGKTPVKTPVKTSVKTPDRILELLAANPELTLAEVAKAIHKSVRAVERASAKLVKEGRLCYVGPTKGGHWEVLS